MRGRARLPYWKRLARAKIFLFFQCHQTVFTPRAMNSVQAIWLQAVVTVHIPRKTIDERHSEI